MRPSFQLDVDLRLLVALYAAPPSGVTVAALAAQSGRGEAYVAIHLKTARLQHGLVEPTMREERLAYVLTAAGREYVEARWDFPERTDSAPELAAPARPELEAPTHLPAPLRALREAWDDGRLTVADGDIFVSIDVASASDATVFFLVRDDGVLERVPEARIHVYVPNDPRECPLCGSRDLYFAPSPMRQACTTCERVVDLLPARLALPPRVASGA